MMSGDANETPPHLRGPPAGATTPPDHVKNPKIFEVFNAPSQSANALPEGYSQNTAGARPQEAKLSEAARMIKWKDFREFHKYPCVRDSLLTGIGGAFGIGGIRLLLRAPVMKACNWAVGTFCFLGIGSYEYCLQKRRLEKANMKRAVEIIDRKKSEKEAKQRLVAEERDRSAKEAEKSRRSSWKFW